jgi:hypothetical protein
MAQNAATAMAKQTVAAAAARPADGVVEVSAAEAHAGHGHQQGGKHDAFHILSFLFAGSQKLRFLSARHPRESSKSIELESKASLRRFA